MILVVKTLENLVPRVLGVGKYGIVAHQKVKQRPAGTVLLPELYMDMPGA
jgi:hypothetical protein